MRPVTLPPLKQKKTSLRKVIKEWEGLFNHLEEAYLIINDEYKIVKANKAFANLQNLPLSKITGQHCYSLIHGTKSVRRNCQYKKVCQYKKSFSAEIYNSQRKCWYSVSTIPIFDQHRHVIGAMHVIKDTYTQKRSSQALAASEKKFQAMLEANPEAVILTDLKGYIMECNRAAIRIYGFTKKHELIGKSVFAFVAPQDQEKAKQIFKKTINKGKLTNVECFFLETDGQTFLGEVSAGTIKDLSGNSVYFVGILKDITERWKTEQLLRDSEEKYRQLFSKGLDAVILQNPVDYKFIDVNPAAEKLYGYSKKEFLSLKLEDICLDPRLTIKAINNVKNKGYVRIHKHYQKKKDGTVFPVEVSISYFRLKERLVLFQILRDITEREKAQKALKDERDTAQSYFDIAGVILVVIDAKECICQMNKRGLEILGYQEKEIIGKNWFDNFLLPNERDPIRCAFRELILGNIAPLEYYENAVLTKTGEVRIIAWHNSVLRDAQGNIIGSLSSGEDVTERKKAEQSLLKSENQLRNQKDALLRKNIALQELLGQIDIDKNQMKNNIIENVDNILIPLLIRLRKKLTPRGREDLDLLKKYLEELTASFGRKISDKYFKLTPREIEICTLIKYGMTSKEISHTLNIAQATVEKNRNTIRKKMGLTKKDYNLTTYLQNF